MLNKNKCLISAIAAALIFFGLQVFYVFALPKIINISANAKKIEQVLNENYNIDAKINAPSVKTFFDFSVKFSAEKIDCKDLNRHNIFSADKFSVRINPLKLLFKELSLKEFHAQNLFLKITRYDEKLFGLENFFKSEVSSGFTASLKDADIKTVNYKVFLDDKFAKKNVVLQGDFFCIKPFKNKLTEITTFGKLYFDDKCSDFNLAVTGDLFSDGKIDLQNYSLTGFINNINLRQLEPYLTVIPNIYSAEGILNLYFNTTKMPDKKRNLLEIKAQAENIALNKGIFEKQFLLSGKNNMLAELNPDKNTLNVGQLLLNGNNIHFKASGKINNYTTEKADLDLDTVITNSRAETIVDILPFGLCNEINLVKKYGISGDVSGALKIRGDALEPDIFGKVEGKNLHALRNIVNSHTGTLKLNFTGKKADIILDLITKSHQTFNLDGIIDVYDKDWSVFDAKTSEKLELPLVKAILVPVSEIFDFQVDPLPIINIKGGTGNASLHIKGMQKIAEIKGFVNLNNASGYFDGVSAFLNKVNAVLDFQNNKVIFYSKNFLADNMLSDLSGHCDIAARGIFEFTLKTNNSSTAALMNIVKKSEMLKEIQSSLQYIDKISGLTDFQVKVTGKYDEDFDFKSINLNDLQTEGFLYLKNNKVKLSDFSCPVERVSGKIDFNEKNISFENLKFGLGKNSDGTISGETAVTSDKNAPMKIKINSPSMELADTLNFVLNSNSAEKYHFKQYNSDAINAKYKLDFSGVIKGDEIDFKTVNADIKFFGNTDKKNKNYISKGQIIIKNNTAILKDLITKIGNSDLLLSGSAFKLSSKFPSYNLYAKTKNINLSALTDFLKSGIFGSNITNSIEKFKDYSGIINVDLRISDRGSVGLVSVKDLAFKHVQTGLPVSFPKFDLNFSNNKIVLSKITGEFGRTTKIPIFLDFSVKNYMKIPYIEGKIMTRLNNAFMERYINAQLTQPIKLTGDIDISSEINGSADSVRIYTQADIPPESDISYMSANLGETDSLRKLIIDTCIHPDSINLKKFEYLKYKIHNRKNIPSPLFIASGVFSRKDFAPKNFAIDTKTKLPAKMLNFIFKKSLIKNGTFDASLKFYGFRKKGQTIGFINLHDAEIPTYGAVVNNAKIKFAENNVNLISSVNLIDTDYTVDADIENSLTLPLKVKKFTLNTKYLNLDNCINTINKWSIDAYMNSSLKTNVPFDISDVIIEKGSLKVDNLDYKSIPMNDLTAKVSLDKNSVLKINVNNLKMADGNICSDINYQVKDGSVSLNLKADGIDSNTIAEAFMGLKNQIEGKFNGKINIKTRGFDSFEQLENLNGNVEFHINQGRMPKLGSLEYLLHATNLIKSGLTALSANGIIELLNPFKDGSFEQINGSFDISKGVVKNIEVFSKGSHLSIYLNGLYDIGESDADIVVYGKFGRKIDGLLGGVGNISLNTFFNLIPKTSDLTEYDAEISKIPDVTYKSNDYRVFRAAVNGNINENNSVSSFKWIK